MNIAIPISSFMWAGGADLIGTFLESLISAYPKNKYYLIVSSNNDIDTKVKHAVYSLLLIPKIGFRKSLTMFKDYKSGEVRAFGLSDFLRQNPVFYNAELITCKNNAKELNKLRSKYKLDIILASSQPLPSGYRGKWVGYITDIQHKHFPHNFNAIEHFRRDRIFKQILARSSGVMVNSLAVKKDVLEFYGDKYANKVHELPVSPFPRPEWLDSLPNVTKKYALPKKYFLISSQLWQHKDHLTAVKALAIINKSYPDIHLFCTGETTDYRNPNYFQGLKDYINREGLGNRVHFLGLIPKLDQISIMNSSIGVIQPSKFEGGPGGGAVQNAISLGVRSIVANIPVNLEIKNKLTHFFEVGSASSLSKKMLYLINHPHKINKQEVINNGDKARRILAKEIINIIGKV